MRPLSYDAEIDNFSIPWGTDGGHLSIFKMESGSYNRSLERFFQNIDFERSSFVL